VGGPAETWTHVARAAALSRPQHLQSRGLPLNRPCRQDLRRPAVMLLPPHQPRPPLLLTGGAGYVGARLLPLLEQQACRLRCLARRPALLRAAVKPTTEIVQGDVLDVASLDRALQGVHTAYYLVHRMAGSQDFAPEDRQAATNFAGAAARAGVRRLI